MDNKFRLIVATIIAICIYILIVFSIILYLKSELVETDKFSSLPKETLIELDFVVENDLEKNIQPQNEEMSQEVFKNQEESSIDTKHPADLKSLFSNISDNGTKQDFQQEVKEQTKNQTINRFKSSIESEKSTQQIELSKLVDLKNITNNSSNINNSSNKGKFDEYYSMINTYILRRWYNFPLLTDVNYLVVANITIDSNGNFRYVMLKYSGDNRVDEAIKLFLKNQMFEKYPVSPDKLTKTIRINFKPYAN